MNADQLRSFKNWFEDYVAGFYGIDGEIDASVELKHEHTRRTCAEMEYITGSMGLEEGQRLVAGTVALFHDLARFEQFRDFRTYKDPLSFDHGRQAVAILEREGLLAGLEERERQIICTAIRHHNMRVLPGDLQGDFLLHARLIRDADKLDIYRVVTKYCRLLREDPDSFKADLDFPVSDEYTPGVLGALMRHETVDYMDLRTMTDMALLQLAWVYDVNFPATLRRIKELGHLSEIASWLPDTPQVQAAAAEVFRYLDNGG